MSELLARLLEWNRNFQRCSQEGRKQLDEEVKRLALFRMISPKQRGELWMNTSKFYPTFQDLHCKVQELIQHELDAKHGVASMDVDE